MTQLRAENLQKTYARKPVVKGISLHVERGEIVGILGPNGAGKTSTFYMLMGLVIPDQGDVYLDDTLITQAPIHQRAQLGLGYLPQESSVFRHLSVEDNILGVLELRKDLKHQARYDMLERLLDEFHLTHVRTSLGQSLSGGERRRCEIARALAVDPKFLLLDEPFAGVDPISILEMKERIKHFAARQIGVIITDHNVQATLDACDRAYIIHQGQVLASGSPQSILAHPEVRRVYLGEHFSF